MTMVLNEEQRLLGDTARELFAAQSPPAAARKLRDSRDERGYDPVLWQRMVDMGWTAIPFPEEAGGLDFGYVGLGAVFEQAGRSLVASPLLSSVVLGGSALLAGGSAAQQRHWLPKIIAGDALFALAIDEQARHDPPGTAFAARRRGDGWVLDGDKLFVLDGQIAGQLLVVARSAGGSGDSHGLTLFQVAADASGVERRRSWLMDGRNAASLRLRGVEVGSDAALGEVDFGAALLEIVLDCARACLAAEMLGMAQTLFDMTLAYLKERVQFDVPIGSFQALQHRCSSLYVDLQLARSTVLGALAAIDAKAENRAQLTSLAKWKMGQTMERVSNEAVQMHGGIGVTDELDVGLYLKRARVAQQSFGDADFHCHRYGGMIGVEQEAP
jgi:hypothetical protein